MSTLLHLVQGTPEWHAHRARYRNASETPAVMGLSPWLSPYQLWEIKTGRKEQAVNYAMQRGTALEPKARTAYEEETGVVMEPCVLVAGDYSASLDGISFAGDLILEVKCPLKGKASETWQAVSQGQVPDHYYWQVQHQLMVSQAGKAHFFVYDGASGEGLWCEVLPAMGDMQRLRAAWEDFWRFIENDQPPPLTGLDTVTRTDPAWKEAAQEFLAARRAADAAAQAIQAARDRLAVLAKHDSERGCGVAVSKFWKAEGSSQEVRVSICRGKEVA